MYHLPKIFNVAISSPSKMFCTADPIVVGLDMKENVLSKKTKTALSGNEILLFTILRFGSSLYTEFKSLIKMAINILD